MRSRGARAVLFGLVALVASIALPACENPFDPLDETDKIQGLSYIDFSSTWERWDSDPQGDGLVVTMTYSNEFGTSLAFHDKPHKLVIEMYTQIDEGGEAVPLPATARAVVKKKGQLFFTKTIQYSNSDDDIRIPIEAYYQAMVAAAPTDYTGFMLVRVYPPEQYPRTELIVAQPDVVFYVEEEAEDTPNI